MGKLLSENYKEILVIYDVTDDRRRRKLVKELGGYIVRVQKSAFQGKLLDRQIQMLIKKMLKSIKKDEDSLTIYIFGSSCRSVNLGKELYEDTAYLYC